ncbi:MAG: hypothetical protein EU541_02950 [Promethearchaeota archaeon]|nr:MAG: hypothetical protein EU541_02950 [Candidatus Lokiarchaeota archaeon]
MSRIEKYILSQEGDIPLIISIPHGGTVKIKSIPRRENGVRGIDKATIKLGKDLIRNINSHLSKMSNELSIPYFVISKVHRAKIDLNRKKSKAYVEDCSISKKIYSLYHQKLRTYVLDSIKKFDKAILIDIHGFETDNRPNGFRDVDIVLGTNNLKSLYSDEIPKKKNWNKNIRGKIIEKMRELNVPVAPELSRRREYILKGGFITQKYGASEIKKSQAIQIEFSERIRLDFKGDKRKNVLNSLAELLVDEILYEDNGVKKV